MSWVLKHPWTILLIAGSLLFAWWVAGTRSQPHYVKAAFPTAFNLARGLDVQIDGVESQFSPAIPSTAGALEAGGGFMADLGRDTFALRGLFINAHRLTRT